VPGFLVGGDDVFHFYKKLGPFIEELFLDILSFVKFCYPPSPVINLCFLFPLF